MNWLLGNLGEGLCLSRPLLVVVTQGTGHYTVTYEQITSDGKSYQEACESFLLQLGHSYRGLLEESRDWYQNSVFSVLSNYISDE